MNSQSLFNVNILGCGSATPSRLHMPSCQVVDHRGRLLMIDCGEGAQLTFRRLGLKFSRLTDIFISHLHGDHLFGLPGLLATLALHGRGGEITVHLLPEGREIIKPFVDFFCRDTPFTIHWHAVTAESGVIFEDSSLTVSTFPLAHRTPAIGFLMREKPGLRPFRPDMRAFYDIPVHAIRAIKEGADYVTPDGRTIPCSRLTLPAPKPLSYAYCSDTMPSQAVVRAVEGVDLLYHEATYLSDMSAQARQRGHSTASEAAEIAKRAGVGTLMIGHYSKRYQSVQPLLDEARAIFPRTIAADECARVDVATGQITYRRQL